MLSAKSYLAGIPVGVAMLALSTSANAVSYPSYGLDTGGPGLIITLSGGGGASVAAGPSYGTPYDGSEDTYIGVENHSGQTVNSILLSAPIGVGIFGFDGDGLAASPYNAPTNGSDSTGYGGPIGFFSNFSQSGGFDFGTLNFLGGLLNGDFTYFSLEEPLGLTDLSVGSSPLPSALPMFLSGLGILGLLVRRRMRQGPAALAT
jgi:hypothetical protein